jgi:hypothetical protein
MQPAYLPIGKHRFLRPIKVEKHCAVNQRGKHPASPRQALEPRYWYLIDMDGTVVMIGLPLAVV